MVNYFDSYRRHSVKVQFSNGDIIKTEINGNVENVVNYYIGSSFNLGKCDVDDLAHGEKIWFYDCEGYAMQHHKTFIQIYKDAHCYVIDHGGKVGLEVHSFKQNGSKYFIDDRRLQLLSIGKNGQKWKRLINKEF